MFAEQLKKIRKKKKISQAFLSKELGVSQATVAGWETGRTTPDPEMLVKIANYFETSVDNLVKQTRLIDNLTISFTPTMDPFPGFGPISRTSLRGYLKECLSTVPAKNEEPLESKSISPTSSAKRELIEKISSPNVDEEIVKELELYLKFLISRKEEEKKEGSTTA